MSLEDKFETMKALVIALEKDRNYWRSRCVKQKEGLTLVSEMVHNVDGISDEILLMLETATQSEYDEALDQL